MLQPKQPVDYTSNVYNALKQKVEGFDKTEEQFKAELSNPEYSSKVYNALKLKVDGFDKSYDEFSSLLKKKEPSRQSSQPISPEKVWGQKSQPKSVYDTLVTDQPKPAVASAISAGKPKIVSYDQYRVDKVKNDLSAIRQKTEQDKIDAKQEVISDFADTGFINKAATFGKNIWNTIVDVNAQGISAVIPGIEQVEQAPEAFRFDIDRSKKFVDKAKREHQDLVKEAIKQKTVNKNIQIPSYDPAKIKERALELAVEEKVGDKVQARVNDYMENLPDRYGNDLKQLVADKYGSEYKQSTKEAKNALDISVMSQKEADDSQLKVNNYANIFAQYKAKGQPVPKEIQARFFIDSKYNEDVHKQAIKDKDNHSNIVAKNNNLAENIDTFNRDYGFLSNTLRNLTSASLHIGSGILGGADYFASLEKNIANRIGIHKFDFAFDTASKIAKYSSEKLKKGAEYIESVSEKSAGVEDVNSIGGFGRFAINEVIAKNAPMLGLIAAGPVGVGAVVQSSIGETFEGMKEQQEMGEKQYSDLQLYGIPAAKGAVDLALFTFDGQMLKNFQRVIKDVTASQKEIMAKAALEQLLKKPATYKEVGKQILGKQMHGLAVMNGVTISKNIIDIVGGVDPDRSITEGTFDASAASLILVGAMHSVPTISAKIGYEITSDTKGMKLSSQILSLEKLMDNETLSQSTRDALKDQHKKATDKLGVVLKKQVRDIQSLSNDQYKEIVGINKKIVELKNKAQDVKIDEKLSDDMKTQILDGYAEDFIAANKRKGELVSNGAKAQFERLSTEEQDKYYKAAEDKLNKELNPDGTTNEKASVYDIVKEAIATKNLEDFEKSKDPLETVDSEPTPTQLTVNEKELEVERLREKERLEKEKVDPNDKEKLDEIYNKYDKLISPLLRDIERAKAEVVPTEEPRIQDSQIPLKKETFEVELDNGSTTTVEVTTNKDGSRSLVTKADGFTSEGEKINKNNTLSTEEYISKAYGEIKGEPKVEQGSEVINPKMKDKLTPKQKEELGIAEEPKTEVSPIELKEGEELIDTAKDKKGRTYTYTGVTSKKDGVKTTKFKFNRSDKSSEQRNDTGVDTDKVLDKYGYEIPEGEIPEGAEIIKIHEVREGTFRGEESIAATVTFKEPETGGTFRGEVNLKRKAKQTTTEKTQGTPDVISEPIDLEIPKPKVEAPKEEVKTEAEHLKHKENIHSKFKEQFKSKGIPEEQIDGAIALMEARAKSWASEEKGRNPEDWYQQIADVKGGEFTKDTKVLYQGIKSLFNKLKIDNNDISDIFDLVGSIDPANINRQYASGKKLRDTPWANLEVKDFRDFFLKRIDNQIESIKGQIEKTNVIDKEGSISELRTNRKKKYLERIDRLKEVRDIIDENLLSTKDMSLNGNILYQVDAWHGSPYSFDKFTTEKMGTGEGNQSFGWGLYFTDVKDIAKKYQALTSKKQNLEIWIGDNTAQGLASEYYKRSDRASSGRLAIKFQDMASFYDVLAREFSYSKALEELRGSEELQRWAKDNVLPYIKEDIGKLYNVTLHEGKSPSEYTWLEWEKPLDVDKIKSILDKDVDGSISEALTHYYSENNDISTTKELIDTIYNEGTTGQELYRILSKNIGENPSDKEASMALLSAGVDGIKYPTDSFGLAFKETSKKGFNYVVFDENAVKINEKIQYQKELGKPKGALETLEDGKVVIHALESPDFSTMAHEIAHIFEKDLTKEEKVVVDKFGGSEAFARGFEKYIREGKAPSVELKDLFEKFKTWMTEIYSKLKGSPIEKRISPEIKGIFDRLLVEKPKEKAKVAEVVEPKTAEVVEPKKVDTSKIDEEIDYYQQQVDYSNSKIYDIEDEIVNEKGNTKSGLIELREQVKKEIEEVKKDKSLSKDERLDKIEEIKYQIENFKEEQQDIIDSYKDDLQAEKADLKKNQKKLDKFTEQKKALLEQETAPVETKKEQLRKNVDDATKSLKDAYNAFKTIGFALDPTEKAKQDLKNQAVLNKAIIDYGVAKFKEKAFTVKEFIEDLASNGVEISEKIARDLHNRIEKAHLAFANLEQGTNSEKVKEKAKGDIEKAYDLGFKEATAQAKDALSAQKEVLGIEKTEALSKQGKKFKEQKESIKQSIKDKIEKSKDAIKNINQIVAESLPLDKLTKVQVKSILNNAMKIFTYKDLNNGIENFVNHVDKVINDVEYQRQIQVKADLINEIKDSISPKSLLKKSEANVKKTKITLKAKESLKTFLDGYSNIDFENLDIPELETIKDQIGDIVKNGKTERQHIENQDRIVKDQIERQIPSFLSEKYENRVQGRFDLAEQLSKGNYMIVDGKIYKPSDLEFVQNNMPGKQTGELIEVPVNKAEANNDFIKKGGFLKNLREGKINKALFGGITGLIKRQNVGHSGIRATFQDLATDSKSMEFLNKHFVTPLELFKNKQIVTYREFTEPFETLLRKSFGKSEKLHTSLFNIWESELKKKGSTIMNKKNEGTYEGKFLTQTDLKIELKREGKENYNIFENKSNSDVVQLYSELKDPMNVRKFLSDGHTIEDIKKIIDFVHSDPKLNDVANGNKSRGIQSLSDLYKNILPKVNETLDLNGHDTIGSKKYLSIEDHRLNEYNKARKAGNNKADAEKIADEKTAVYAEVLKAFYGENVPEEVPYVPSAVEPTQEVDLDVLKQFEDFHNGNSTLLFGNLYGRKEGGSLVLRPFQDVFREYAQNSSRFIEGASSMKNVSNLFLGKANEKLLIKNLGSDWVNLAKNKSIGILTGKSEFDVMKKSDFGNKIGQWTTLKTGLQLVLTPVTMIGQVLGTPNFYMSLENLADRQRYRKIYTDSNLRGKYYKAILNSSLMDERINKSGHDVDSDMLRKMSNGKSAGVRELSSSLVSDGLILTAISDAAAILYGGIGLYGVEYERNFSEYKKTMSPKDADLKAERDAMIKLFAVAEKTQASSQEAFTGRYLKDPLAKALGLYSFQGPSIQMGSLAMEAYRDVKAGRVDKIDGLKKIAYFGMVGAIMFNAAKKLLPKDDDKVDATGGEFELANETFSDILNQFGILGKQVAILKDEILKSSFPKALGVPYDNSKEKVTDKILRVLGQESPAFGATVRTAKKILDSDEQYSLYRRASAAIETVGLFPADKVNNIATRVTELFDTDFKWGDRVKILTGLMNETSMLKYKDKVEDIQKMSATPEIKGMNYKERIAYSKLKGQEAIDFKNSIEQENQLNFIERQMGILKENGIGYESEISRIKAEISRTKNSIVEDYIKPALELNESGDIEKAKKINEKFINMMIDMEKNNPEMYANIENNIQTMIDNEANKKSSFVNDIKKAPIGRARAMAIYSRFGDLLDPKDDMLVSVNVLANAKLLDDVTVSAYKKLVSEQKLKERNK